MIIWWRLCRGSNSSDWGAGALLKEYEERLYEKAHSGIVTSYPDFFEPLRLHDSKVRPEWLDYNGHMTESRYLQVFGDTTDAFLNFIGMDKNYRKHGFFSLYSGNAHPACYVKFQWGRTAFC